MTDLNAHSYALATQKSRRIVHVHEDGKTTAMCGARNVRYVGEVDQPYKDSWPYCEACKGLCEAMDDCWWWNAEVFAHG